MVDTVTKFTLTEEGSSNIKERQMLKAECFLILSQILESPNVFDDARKRIDDISAIVDDQSMASNGSSIRRREDLKYKHLDRSDSPLLDRPLSPLSMSAAGNTDTEDENFSLPSVMGSPKLRLSNPISYKNKKQMLGSKSTSL